MNKKILIVIIVIILILIAFLGVARITNTKEDSSSDVSNINENNQELFVSNESETSTTENNIKSYYSEDDVSVPVSNSNAPAGEIVWKSFNINNDESQIDLSDWESSNINNLYYKKITSYSEYKELMDNYSKAVIMTNWHTDFILDIETDD